MDVKLEFRDKFYDIIEHYKCPSSEKLAEKCIFRKSYVHHSEPTYGSLDYFVFVSLDSEQSEEESLEEGDVSDDVSEPVGDENGSEETVEETGGDSAQISQELDEEESEEPDDDDDDDDDEVNTVERKKSAKEGH